MGSSLRQSNLANKSHVFDLGNLFGCWIFFAKVEQQTDTTDEFTIPVLDVSSTKKMKVHKIRRVTNSSTSHSIASFYGIFTYIYHKNQPTHVGKYTIFYGSYGDSSPKFCVFNPRFSNFTTTLRVAENIEGFCFLVPTATAAVHFVSLVFTACMQGKTCNSWQRSTIFWRHWVWTTFNNLGFFGHPREPNKALSRCGDFFSGNVASICSLRFLFRSYEVGAQLEWNMNIDHFFENWFSSKKIEDWFS